MIVTVIFKIFISKLLKLLILTVMFVLPSFAMQNYVFRTSSENPIIKNISLSPPEKVEFPDFIMTQLHDYEELLRQRSEEIKLSNEINEEINKVERFFDVYNGGAVIKGYGKIIVEQARRCGGDYKILVGIAGNESGLGRVPYKKYNPFGYIDGVQYSSWEEAIKKLSCVISQRFIAPCNKDLYCIINKYGGHDTDREKWIKNVSWFMSQV